MLVELEPLDFTFVCFPLRFASVSSLREFVVVVVAPCWSVLESVRVVSVRVFTFFPSCVCRVTVRSELDVAPGVWANVNPTAINEASASLFMRVPLCRFDRNRLQAVSQFSVEIDTMPR